MSGFKQCHAIANVGTGGHAQPANLRRGRIAHVIAVQIECGNHIIIGRACQQLLQHVIGNYVFNDNVFAIVGVLHNVPGAAFPRFCTKLFAGQLVSPITECAFREFHDVALMYQGHALAVAVNGILNGLTYQPLCAECTDRFNANSAVRTDIFAQFGVHKVNDGLCFFCFSSPFNARIHIFCVFPEDYNVHLFRFANGAGCAGNPANRPYTGVQVQNLPQGHVEAAETAADGGGKGAFNANEEFAHGFKGFFWHVVAIVQGGCFFAGVNFHPGNFAFAAIGFFYGRIPNADRGRCNVYADTISFDESDDGVIRDIQLAIAEGDFFTIGNLYVLISHLGFSWFVSFV